jgi:formylglycine-generating enzyme required for sulfatase activity
MRLVAIPPGTFLMGSHEPLATVAREYKVLAARIEDEYPQHPVRITRPFDMGTCEVTVGQFKQFVKAAGYLTDGEKGGKGGGTFKGSEGVVCKATVMQMKERGETRFTWRNPGFDQTDDHPVVNVSWHDAVAFCEWLSRKEGAEYRLPTEAQWEYACRAGTTTHYYNGDDPEALVRVANVADAALRKQFPQWDYPLKGNDGYAFTAPVGKFRPNRFGLHDMHGNVWEWCADWYDKHYYQLKVRDDPPGPRHGRLRCLRGGCWY